MSFLLYRPSTNFSGYLSGGSGSESDMEFTSGPPQAKKLKTSKTSSDVISKLHAKLNQFRKEDQYCDITIRVQQAVFKCHRLVLVAMSEYFNLMFNGNFEECTKKEIELVDVDAEAFGEILNFVYTGIIPTLTESNVYSLLRTGEYLNMSEIEDECIEYIQKNLSSIKNIVQIFRFAVCTNKKCLTETLIRHICQNFRLFSADEELLELPFDEFNMLMKEHSLSISECTYLRFKDENLFMDTLMRWIHHSRQERLNYVEKLLRLIDFERISAEYKTFLLHKYKIQCSDELFLEKAVSENLCSSVDIDIPPLSLNDYLVSSECKLTLYAFVWYFKEQIRYESMRVFSMNEQNPLWSAVCNVASYPNSNMKTIVLENTSDYFFSFSSDKGGRSEFYTYPSVKFPENFKQKLKCPPCSSHLFDMCGKHDYIYWYNSEIHYSLHYQNVKLQSFNQEESRRGIYGYISQQNIWFPLPGMKEKLANACMTSDDHLIYLIGGIKPNKENLAGYVQGYDCRTPTWLELPKTGQSYYNAVSCSLNGKIYVSDGTMVEMYNSAAGKWEMISKMCQDESQRFKYAHKFMRMIPYKNQLWIFNDFKRTFIIDPHDQSSKKNWCTSELLRNEIGKHYGYCNSDDEDAYDWYRGRYGERVSQNATDLETSAEIRDVLVFKDL